jgi:hypothetical protein
MRPGQNNNSNNNNNNKNRSRGRSNNNGGRKHLNPLSRNYESNGPDMKVRGNAAHIAEKYVQLARDAHGSGDSVMAENYLQHAEHYFRIVSSSQPQIRTDQPGQEFESEESDDDYASDEQSRFDTPQFRASLQNDRPYQDDRQQPPRNDQPQGDRQQGERQQGDRPQGERQQSDNRQQQSDRQPRFEQASQRSELPRVDAPSVETGDSQEAQPAVAAEAAAPADGEPRRVRERRPRRRRPPMGENGAVDPDGPQPEVGELPAFITAGGATNGAE